MCTKTTKTKVTKDLIKYIRKRQKIKQIILKIIINGEEKIKSYVKG